MLIRIVQALIVCAVVFSNIQWQWTPNPLLAAVCGVGAAFFLTVLPVEYFHKYRVWKARKARVNRPLARRPSRQPVSRQYDDFDE